MAPVSLCRYRICPGRKTLALTDYETFAQLYFHTSVQKSLFFVLDCEILKYDVHSAVDAIFREVGKIFM